MAKDTAALIGKGLQSHWLALAVLYANINALNFMRAAIGSQCKLMKRGVTCPPFGLLKLILPPQDLLNAAIRHEDIRIS